MSGRGEIWWIHKEKLFDMERSSYYFPTLPMATLNPGIYSDTGLWTLSEC